MKKDIHVHTLENGAEVHVVNVDTPGVAAFSVFTPYNTLLETPEEKEVMSLAAHLCGDDTKKHTKQELNDTIRECGAELSYGSGTDSFGVLGRTPKKHLLEVLDIAFEGLYLPKFSKNDFIQRVRREYTQLEESITDPDTRAAEEFSQAMYPKGHPNYDTKNEDQLRILPAIELATIKAAHKEQVQGVAPIILLVGDVPATITKDISKLLAEYKINETRTLLPHGCVATLPAAKQSIVTSIPDKENAAVVIGQPLPVLPSDEDYYPVRILLGLLGGGATAHLFRTVRERDGLTYGIYAQVHGAHKTSPGAWYIDASLSPQNVKHGIEVIEKELNSFLKNGITKESVAQKKKEMMQKFWTGMQGVGRILAAYQSNYTSGFTPEEFYLHPDKIEKVTLEDVKRVAKKYFDPNTLTTIVAGSVDKKYAPLKKS